MFKRLREMGSVYDVLSKKTEPLGGGQLQTSGLALIDGACRMSDETWQGLVDIDRLCGWMDGERLGRGPIEDPTSLTGGTQNVLLQFRRDGRSR